MKALSATRFVTLLGACIFASPYLRSAPVSDLTGTWHGTWQITQSAGVTSNFSMTFWNPDAESVVATMYVPEFGLFGHPQVDTLPVIVETQSAGPTVITIGVPWVAELTAEVYGDCMIGWFYAFLQQNPPVFYSGFWQAQKATQEVPVPPPGPGPDCPDLPAPFCVGDAAECSELVLFHPLEGPGYLDYPSAPETEEDRCFSYLRRDLMMLVKYAAAKTACKTIDWDHGNTAPLGLGDMSEAIGAVPGTSFGFLRHPPGSHENGRDIDTAYYQIYALDNLLRPIGMHYQGVIDAYHLVAVPYALDVWRTALYIAYLSEHPRIRVIGVDGKAGPRLETALDDLVSLGWVSQQLRDSVPLAYESECTGLGWYLYHHTHLHTSMNPVHDLVASLAVEPETLNPKSRGRFVTAYVECHDSIDVTDVDLDSIALILGGYHILYPYAGRATVTDYNQNGIPDLTVQFDRRDVLSLAPPGIVSVAVTGIVDGRFSRKPTPSGSSGLPANPMPGKMSGRGRLYSTVREPVGSSATRRRAAI